MSAASTDPGPEPGGARRPGARRATPPPRTSRPGLVRYALAAVAAVVAWVALVVVAIHFGRSARGGDGGDWALLALVSAGAAGCLFLALMLVTAALRRAGIIATRTPHRH